MPSHPIQFMTRRNGLAKYTRASWPHVLDNRPPTHTQMHYRQVEKVFRHADVARYRLHARDSGVYQCLQRADVKHNETNRCVLLGFHVVVVVVAFQAMSSEFIITSRSDFEPGHAGLVTRCSFHPREPVLACAVDGGRVCVYEADDFGVPFSQWKHVALNPAQQYPAFCLEWNVSIR